MNILVILCFVVQLRVALFLKNVSCSYLFFEIISTFYPHDLINKINLFIKTIEN